MFDNVRGCFCIVDKMEIVITRKSFDFFENKDFLNALLERKIVYEGGAINLNMLLTSLLQIV